MSCDRRLVGTDAYGNEVVVLVWDAAAVAEVWVAGDQMAVVHETQDSVLGRTVQP